MSLRHSTNTLNYHPAGFDSIYYALAIIGARHHQAASSTNRRGFASQPGSRQQEQETAIALLQYLARLFVIAL
jgi:hypothetical protein